jgi:hypothetical protein
LVAVLVTEVGAAVPFPFGPQGPEQGGESAPQEEQPTRPPAPPAQDGPTDDGAGLTATDRVFMEAAAVVPAPAFGPGRHTALAALLAGAALAAGAQALPGTARTRRRPAWPEGPQSE